MWMQSWLTAEKRSCAASQWKRIQNAGEGQRESSVVSYGVKWKQFCGRFLLTLVCVLGTTSEHADISGLYARSSALVQGIPRADWAVTHGFGGVEPVPRATYITTPSKPVFVSLVSRSQVNMP